MKTVQPVEVISSEEPEIRMKRFSPNPKGKYHIQHLDVDWRITRKWLLKK